MGRRKEGRERGHEHQKQETGLRTVQYKGGGVEVANRVELGDTLFE